MRTVIIFVLTIVILGVVRAFRKKKGKSFIRNSDLLPVGPLLFPNETEKFETFFNSYLDDKKKFLFENEQILEEYEFDNEKLTALEVIYIFGDQNKKTFITDWRGEENESEIESFLETDVSIKTDWNNVEQLRKEIDEDQQRDGKFIIDLFKNIDKDLAPLNKKLVFFNLGWDAYVYTVVDSGSFATLNNRFGSFFHGTEKLRK
jgi:hypothetical protein